MADQNNISFPMLSEKNWWIIREKFKASIPSAVTPTYVKSLLSMANDNSANSNVISPLKRLGLIDEDNKPTPLANEWRLDEKYKEVCDKILGAVYPKELLDIFTDPEVDRNSARTWFMSQGVGQGAADKMVALFAMLKSGEIKDKKFSQTDKNGNNRTVSTVQKKPKTTVAETQPKQPQPENKSVAPAVNRPNLHIDLQIHISPESTPEQIECIFASMAKHLYGEK